ncbi:MAG: hypothetical protein MUF10_16170 [Thermoanaerobaculaceae bacterium]|jgi:hypothetical protein|nr:hypothetical protein [Thermoanaerobaculaceae bacterium]
MRKLVLVLVMLAIAGAVLALPPAKESFVLSAGQGTGSGTTQWRTDVWIYNPSTTQKATVDIFFLPRTSGSAANTNPTSRRVEVNAGATRELLQILATNFGLTGANFGALRFLSDVDVVVTGRIYDANVKIQGQTNAGTAGQFFPGLASGLAIASGQFTDIVGLQQDTVSRSNLAFVEVTGNGANLKLERINESGVVQATITDAIGAYGARQINRVLESLQGAATTNQRVRVTVTGGSGKVLVAASRLDQITNDPYTIEMTTTAGVGVPSTGRFEGAVALSTTPDAIDGALRLTVGASSLTDFSGVAGIPCNGYSYTGDFSATAGSVIPITGNSFPATSVTVPYQGGSTGTLFTTVWTLTGTRAANGVWSGTLTSATSGATGDDLSCNGTHSHAWTAGWVGN